jgi:hypothetical protein
VSIGLISYPLYLWHWTLLSFARIVEEATPSPVKRISAIILSFLLAWLTYQFIEKPLRSRSGSKMLVAILLAALIGMLLLGFWSAAKPLETTMPSVVLPEDWMGWQKCDNDGNCWIIDPLRPVEISVIGDSHAGYLGFGLAEAFRESGENIQLKRHNMCLPFFSMVFDGKKYFDCGGFIDRALEESLSSPSVKTIVLSGYANLFIYDYPDGVPWNANLRELSSQTSTRPNPVHIAAFSKGLDFTLDRLSRSGKRIVFLVDNPEIDFEPRECVSLRPFTLPGHQLRTPCAISLAAYKNRTADDHQILVEVGKKYPAVKFIYSDKYLCDRDWCWAVISEASIEYGETNGTLIYGDRNHLTPAGGSYLLRRIRDQIVP